MDAGNCTLPVAKPRINPAMTERVRGGRGIEAIKLAASEAWKIWRKMNIPRIMKVKFQGFIRREISFRFNVNLLKAKERKRLAETAMRVAISLTGRVAILCRVKSRAGATRITPKGGSNLFQEKLSE